MSLLQPRKPPYDALAWRALPLDERLRQACRAWALQGYGTPPAVYLLYALKVVFYIGMWCFFCSFTPGLGDPWTIGEWWLAPLAFQKAVLWSLGFEVLGLGCASGPLTARYLPPVAACLHFARPGTVRLPCLDLPLLRGNRRSLLDAALYLGLLGSLGYALCAAELRPALLLPPVILLALLGLRDKTVFLCARAEHYWVTAVCFLFPDWLAGAQAVQLGIWFWAAVSKLTHHFPTAVCVMTSNSPAMPFAAVRRRLYRSFPDDLRPSRLAVSLAHLGTAQELAFPFLLALSAGGWGTWIGLGMVLLFHCYITSNVPMAVPIEWNVHVVYGAFFLFLRPERLAFESWPLVGFVFVMLVLVPLLGNFFPRFVSFLFSMRYYAGNWPYSVWLFRPEAKRKLESSIPKASAWVSDQLARFYDAETIAAIESKIPAFRAMHLHGRALSLLLPKTVDDLGEYTWLDGELVAGLVLGWNFGDGHLHDERLLAAVQERCGFAPGELRCLFVESQPLFGSGQAWRIVDAAGGELAAGTVETATLRALQPWGESGPETRPEAA